MTIHTNAAPDLDRLTEDLAAELEVDNSADLSHVTVLVKRESNLLRDDIDRLERDLSRHTWRRRRTEERLQQIRDEYRDAMLANQQAADTEAATRRLLRIRRQSLLDVES